MVICLDIYKMKPLFCQSNQKGTILNLLRSFRASAFLSLLIVNLSHSNECRDAFVKGKIRDAQRICQNMSQNHAKGTQEFIWAKLILFDTAHYLGEQEKAYYQLIDLAELELSQNFKYELLRRQGHYYRLQKRHSNAENYYREALTIAEQLNNKLYLAKSYNDMGLMGLKKNQYEYSIDFFKKSLKIKRELGDDSLVRSTITNLGLLYYRTGDYKEAIENYKIAETILTNKIEDSNLTSQHQLIHLYSYLAAAYNKLNDEKLAENYLLLLDKNIKNLHNDTEILNRYVNLTEVLIDTGSYEVARRVINKANLEYKNNESNNAQLFYQMGLLESQFNNNKLAKIHANNALAEMNHHQDFSLSTKLYLLLSQIEESLIETSSSLKWFKRYHEASIQDLKDQIDSDFKVQKYEMILEDKRLALIQLRLSQVQLEKRNYIFGLGFIILMILLSVAMIIFHYQRKVMKTKALLLNKDIEKHKQILSILQKTPINFEHVFKNKKFPLLVLDESDGILFCNWRWDLELQESIVSHLKQSNEQVFSKEMLVNEKMKIFVKNLDEKFTHINVQNILTNKYLLLSFCNSEINLGLETELNAMSQFDFYLKQNRVNDLTYLRQLIVDCMCLCIDIWYKATSSNRV